MQATMPKLKVLFLCTGNSCRSQMAEGWARKLKASEVEAYSAGIEKHGMNPHAVRVMGEAGVDISRQYSKTPQDIGPVEKPGMNPHAVRVMGEAGVDISRQYSKTPQDIGPVEKHGMNPHAVRVMGEAG